MRASGINKIMGMGLLRAGHVWIGRLEWPGRLRCAALPEDNPMAKMSHVQRSGRTDDGAGAALRCAWGWRRLTWPCGCANALDGSWPGERAGRVCMSVIVGSSRSWSGAGELCVVYCSRCMMQYRKYGML